MVKLKVGALQDDKPVTLTLKLPADIYRDLVAYAEVLKQEAGQSIDPTSLIAPMLKRFMATDRAFTKSRKSAHQPNAK